MSLKCIDEEQTEKVVRRLNNRPGKTLGGKTPHEVMYKEPTVLTSRVAVTT